MCWSVDAPDDFSSKILCDFKVFTAAVGVAAGLDDGILRAQERRMESEQCHQLIAGRCFCRNGINHQQKCNFMSFFVNCILHECLFSLLCTVIL